MPKAKYRMPKGRKFMPGMIKGSFNLYGVMTNTTKKNGNHKVGGKVNMW